jgi:hypothetical protein
MAPRLTRRANQRHFFIIAKSIESPRRTGRGLFAGAAAQRTLTKAAQAAANPAPTRT